MKFDVLFAILACTSVLKLVAPRDVSHQDELLELVAALRKFNTSNHDLNARNFTANRTLLPRSLIQKTCGLGPRGDNKRKTLENIVDYVAKMGRMLRLAADVERKDEGDTRIFETAFGNRMPQTRRYIRRRYAAIEKETDQHQEGHVFLRCDDPWKECTRNPQLVICPHLVANTLILVRARIFQ